MLPGEQAHHMGTAFRRSSVGKINDKRDVSILSDGILNKIPGKHCENHRHTHSRPVLRETFYSGAKLRKEHDPSHRFIKDENGGNDTFLESSRLSEERGVVAVEVTTSCGIQELQSAVNLRRDSPTEFLRISDGVLLVIEVVYRC
jgi:hypothetical protein